MVTAAVCVAGVALGDIDLHFAWQAWHLATSTCTLCGRCGAYGTGLALVVGLALGDSPHFACEASRNSFTHLTSTSSTCISCTSHTHPPPSLFSFLPFPSHFHFSLATYWKKLTCGVIRSFNSYWSHRPLLLFAIHWHPCWPWILRKLLGAMVRMVEIKPLKISG